MSRRRDSGPDGVAVIDKDAGWTSHDVVAKSRGLLGTRKVGHSGTLDPDATGVLVLGVGRVTRLLRYLTALPKTYVGEMSLGVETSTLDAAGEVTATHDMAGVTLDQVVEAAAAFVGDIEQIPPMVSAIKIDGKRLHELAREGKEVDRPPRPVTIHRLDVSPTEGAGVFQLDVDCSSGTYIRTLAADIGTALGGGAHLRSLRRTAIGSFDLTAARPLEEIELLDPVEALRDYARIVVDDELAGLVRHGRVLGDADLGAMGDGPWAIVGPAGNLLAMYERTGSERVKPSVVLAPAAT